MDETFLLSILIKAIDDASPTIARVAAEVEALKAATAGEAGARVSPTRQLADDIEATGLSSAASEGRIRGFRKEFETAGTSVKSAQDKLGAYKEKVDDVSASQSKLAESTNDLSNAQEGLSDIARDSTVTTDKQAAAYQAAADAADLKAAATDRLATSERGRTETLLNEGQAQEKTLTQTLKSTSEMDAGHARLERRIARLEKRIERTAIAYDDFVDRMESGKLTINDAVLGYQKMGAELNNIANTANRLTPASDQAIQFARAAQAASNEARRLNSFVTADAGSALERGAVDVERDSRRGLRGLGGIPHPHFSMFGNFRSGIGLHSLGWRALAGSEHALSGLGGGGGFRGGGGFGGAAAGGADDAFWASLIMGKGGRGGSFGLPAFGSLGGLAGFGPEHFALTGAGLLGSAGSALGGASLMGLSSLTQLGIGGGTDLLYTKDTFDRAKQMSTEVQALAEAVAVYGKNSSEAKSAQYALNQQWAEMGGGIGKQAIQTLDTAAMKVKALFDADSGPARAAAAHLMTQVVGVAKAYVPDLSKFGATNLGIINQSFKPFFEWLKGPDGMGIVKELEDAFAKHLPTAIKAFSLGMEDFLRLMAVASKYTGGLARDLANLFGRKSREPISDYRREVQKLVDDAHLWGKFFKELFSDIHGIFKLDAGTAPSIVKSLTEMLTRLQEWEKSTSGADEIHTIFEVHRKQIDALLSLLPPLLQLFGRFYLNIAPPVTLAFTEIVKAVSWLANRLINLGNHLGPLKSLWNDGILVPFAAFLVLWRHLGSASAAINAPIRVFNALKSSIMGVLGVAKALPDAFKALFGLSDGASGFGAAFQKLKDGWSSGANTSELSAADQMAADQMKAAFTEGGDYAAAAIREALMQGGVTAGEEIGTAEVAGGGTDVIGGSGGDSEVEDDALDAGGAATGWAALRGGLSSAASRLGPLAGLLLGGTDIFHAIQGAPTDQGQGLSSLLGNVPTNKYIAPNQAGTVGGSIENALSTTPLIGGLVFGATGSTSGTTVALQKIQTQLQGITSPAQLSSKAISQLITEIDQAQNMPDLTAKNRAGLAQLAQDFGPVNLAMSKYQSSYQDIDTTTSAIWPQIKEIVASNSQSITSNLTSGSAQWKTAIEGNYGAAISTLESLNSQGVLSTSKMAQDINNIMRQELVTLGVSSAMVKTLSPGQLTTLTTGNFSGVPTLSQTFPGKASGGFEQPQNGGRLINVAEGGYPEVVLTTDPKYASRQRELLGRYLQSAPHVLGLASGGIVEPTWTGPGGLIGDVGQTADNTMFQALQAKLAQEKASQSAGGAGNVPGGTQGLSGALISIVTQIASRMKWTGQVQDWLNVINKESGGSMTARNPSSGAYGIAQFINGASEYAQYGGNSSTLSGQLVAMASYISQRYGDPANAWAHELSHNWYAKGGWIPGIAAAKGFLGTVNSPTMFLAGEAGAEHVSVIPQAASGNFFSPSNVPYSSVTSFLSNISTLSNSNQTQSLAPQDIQLAINNLYSGIKHTVDNLGKFSTYLSNITTSGGPLDQLDQAVQDLFTEMSNKVIQMAIFINKQGLAVQREQPAEQDQGLVAAYHKEYEAIGREQQIDSRAQSGVVSRLSKTLGVNRKRLSGRTPLQLQALLKGRISRLPKASRKQADNLLSQYANLYSRGDTLQSESAQTLSSMYGQESTELSDQMTQISDVSGTRADELSTRAESMQNLGTLGTQAGQQLTQQIVANANGQISQYTKVLKQATLQGNKDMAAQAQQQIDQLQQTISEAATQLLQAQVDTFTQNSEYQMNALQRQSSYATNVVGAGVQGYGGAAQTAAAQMQLGVLQQTGTALSSQLQQAQSLYQGAEMQGNSQLASQLLDQIGALNEQLDENTQAISNQTTAVTQATIDWVNATTQFQTGVFGGLFSAVQTMGQMTGGIDVKTGTQILNATQNALSGSISSLLGTLSSSYGVNLPFNANNPTSLIQGIAGLNFNKLESGMTAAQQTQFTGLITQITQNIGALEQNTEQLQTLNGQLNQPQQWSSSAWSTFRSAFFTGMGGMLPSIGSIPQMASGGQIVKEGIAYLHPAEVVQPADSSMFGGDVNIHTTLNQAGQVYDPVHAGHRQAFAFKTAARSS